MFVNKNKISKNIHTALTICSFKFFGKANLSINSLLEIHTAIKSNAQTLKYSSILFNIIKFSKGNKK